jgi:ketosteroid isomerase-like protein
VLRGRCPRTTSSAIVDTKGAHLWTLRDGKVVRLEIFADRAGALAAVGLDSA